VKNYFSLKRSAHCKLGDIQSMNPKLMYVFAHLLIFCDGNKVPCVITNITGKFKQSTSSTHPTGRAFDMSLRGWPNAKIDECKEYMEAVAGHYGAISARTYKKRLVVHHDVGLGDHFHFQVFR